VPIPLDQLPNDSEALKRIIAAMAQDAANAQAEIAKLRFQLARYRRAECKRSVKDACRRSSVGAMMGHGGDRKGSVHYRVGGH